VVRRLRPQALALDHGRARPQILPGTEPVAAGSCTAPDLAHRLTSTPNVQLYAGLLEPGIDLVPAQNGGYMAALRELMPITLRE